jgi:hypothetical protein
LKSPKSVICVHDKETFPRPGVAVTAVGAAARLKVVNEERVDSIEVAAVDTTDA